jgi:hypothetical protein
VRDSAAEQRSEGVEAADRGSDCGCESVRVRKFLIE